MHLGVTTWFVELKDGHFGVVSIAWFEKLMKKLCTYEIGGVKMKKNEKKNGFFNFKNVFFYYIFLVVSLALHFKDDL